MIENVLNVSVTNEDWLAALEVDPWATVIAYYAACLPLHEKIRSQVVQRLQLSDEQLLEQQIGFADRSLGSLIPHRRTKQGLRVRQQLEALGLYKSNGRETLRGCITRPVYDPLSQELLGIEAWPVDPHSELPERIWLPMSRTTSEPDSNHSQVVNPITSEEVPEEVQPEPTLHRTTSNSSSTSHSSPNTQDSPAKHVATTNASVPEATLRVDGRDLLFTSGDREYRVRGWQANPAGTSLEVNLRIRRQALVHVDTLDLLKASARHNFQRAAAAELYCDEGSLKQDLGQLLLALEQQPSAPTIEQSEPPAMTATERDAALKFLRSPNLIERLAQDLGTAGIVGEQLNQMVGYLVAVSRKDRIPRSAVRFTRRQLRRALKCGDYAMRTHLATLVLLEYVLIHRGRNGQQYVYELMVDYGDLEDELTELSSSDMDSEKPPLSTTPAKSQFS